MDTVVSLIGNDPRRIGGTEEYARELSRQLGECGWRSVLCFSGKPSAEVADYLALPNVMIETLGEPWVIRPALLAGLTRILRRYRPRILHSMFTGFLSPFPWIARICSVEKVFFTDHGSRPAGYVPQRAPGWKRVAARWINAPLTGVICVSEFNRSALSTLDTYSAGRIETIPNGIRIPGSAPDPAQFRRRFGIPDGRVCVVQVGSISEEKGVSDVLTAARIILDTRRDVQFLFVGDGREKPRFMEEARFLGDHVTWTGLVSNPGAEGVYSVADIVCQASRWQEAFGLVIAEAMSYARPVVATRAGGIPELVRDGHTGYLVPVKDAAALADRILTLAGDTALRQQFGANARMDAESKYDIRRVVARHLELYGVSPRPPVLQSS